MPAASNLSKVFNGATFDEEAMPTLSTCHQCRQKTPNFSASCKNVKGNKRCLLKMCHRCLFNRYGEVAQTVCLLEDWKCPKCRGICNCSFCMKKSGYLPTGLLVYKAEENGFSSVSDLLHSQSSDIKTETEKSVKHKRKREQLAEITLSVANNDTSPQQSNGKETQTKKKVSKLMGTEENATAPKRSKHCASEVKNRANGRLKIVLKGTNDTPMEKSSHKSKQKKNSADATDFVDPEGGKVNAKRNTTTSKMKKLTHFFNEPAKTPLKPHRFIIKTPQKEKKPSLPRGIRVDSISGIDFSPKDVGEALQFLEFCETFGKKVLKLKKGQAEAIIKDILNNKRQLRSDRSQHSLLSQTHISLMNIIKGRENLSVGKHSWVLSLGEIVSELKHVFKEFAREDFEKGFNYYNKLKPLDKLKLLNMLCDEALNTKEMRKWIDDQYALVAKRQKEGKENVADAKAKEREIVKKIQEHIRSGSKNGVFCGKLALLNDEAKKARKNIADAISVISNNEKGYSILRTEPSLMDTNGRVFWRLRCRHGLSDLLLQDIKDSSLNDEAWFSYDPLEENDVENYLSWFKKRIAQTNVPSIVEF